MERKYGLDMLLPEGKLPGFYAQIVKGIAARAPLFDRVKELLVFADAGHLSAVRELLDHYKVAAEPVDLLLLPETGVEPGALYADYAIESASGNVYVDLAYAFAFRLTPARPDAEPDPALRQLEEHLIATVDHSEERWLLVDRSLDELAERIAAAYGCAVRPLDTA